MGTARHCSATWGEHSSARFTQHGLLLLAGTLLGFETGFIAIVIADLLFCQAAFLLARHYAHGSSPLVGQGAMARIEGVGRDQFQGNPFCSRDY